MPVTKQNKDNELIDLVRQKSRQGFERLYSEYAGALYGVTKQMITDEPAAQKILEETLTSAWVHIEQYNVKEQSFFIWLLFICRRICKQHLLNEMPVKMQQAGNENTGNCQSVLEMVLLRGQSYDEVAKIMNVPASSILSSTRAGLQGLRKGQK
jgi:DNA-directed RNA polymerase specialized sigma24 family protein